MKEKEGRGKEKVRDEERGRKQKTGKCGSKKE